jgi:hypothetical protein
MSAQKPRQGAPPAPLASIYSDATLVTPLANPTVADACGDFPTIYAAQGNYKSLHHRNRTDSENVHHVCSEWQSRAAV